MLLKGAIFNNLTRQYGEKTERTDNGVPEGTRSQKSSVFEKVLLLNCNVEQKKERTFGPLPVVRIKTQKKAYFLMNF